LTNQKQQWPVVAMYINPIRFQTWLPQTILVSDWLISKKIFSSETAFPNELKFGRKHLAILIEDLSRMLPTKFRFIWPSSFRGEDFKKSANQKQELPVAAMFVNGLGQNEHSL
jgi:hypothetical protein